MDSNSLSYIIKYIGILFSCFALIGIGYQLIIYKTNVEKRTNAMRRFIYVFIGLLIIGSTLTISSVIYNSAKEMNSTINSESSFQGQEIEFEDDKGNFLEKGIASALNTINHWVLGDEKSDGLAKKVLGFDDLGSLFFEKSTINLAGGKTNDAMTYGPLTEKEWNTCMGVNYTLLAITIPLIIIMVGKTGLMYIFNSSSMTKIEKVKEDNKRWLFVILLLAFSPVMLKVFFTFINSISEMIYNSFSNVIITSPILGGSKSMDNMKTGSFLVTAIMKFLYAKEYLLINAAFIARKWVLIVMLSLSPIIFVLWGINDKVHAFDIWFGEIVTNATMGICYGLVFTIMSLFIADGANIIMLIIGLKMATKLAETLRNSLQGFFTRMAGVNEMQSGMLGLGAVGGIMSGAFNLFSASKAGNMSNPMQGESNSFGTVFGGSKGKGQGQSTSNSSGGAMASKSGNEQIMKDSMAKSGVLDDVGRNGIGEKILEDTTPKGGKSGGVGGIGEKSNPIGGPKIDDMDKGSPIDDKLGNPSPSPIDEDTEANIPGLRDFGEDKSDAEGVEKDSSADAPEPKVVTHNGEYGAVAGQKAVDKLNTKIGENQEFSNVLGKSYDKYRAKSFGNVLGYLGTSGSPELAKFGKGVADMSNGIYNAGAMAKAIYKASNHVASQRNADGEKAGFKQTMAVAKEMLSTNKVTAENQNGTMYLDTDNKKGANAIQRVARSTGADSVARGARLIGAATISKNDSIPKILINNSMQKKVNNTYLDWSKTGTFNGNDSKKYFS